MSKLPRLSATDYGKTNIINFQGINTTATAVEGEWEKLINLNLDNYPYLKTRNDRIAYKSLKNYNGFFAKEEICYVDGTDFYFKGEKKGEVEDSLKTFASFGAYILIFPDKKYYNTATDEFGSLEASTTATQVVVKDVIGDVVTTQNNDSGSTTITTSTGNYSYSKGEKVVLTEDDDGNTLVNYCEVIVNGDTAYLDDFKVGDSVTFEGFSEEANNKTAIIRGLSGNRLMFYEYSFIDGTYNETITVKREVPDMDMFCENNNRLWGCKAERSDKGSEIWACKLGDPFNWAVLDGLSNGSFYAQIASDGNFTGAITYLGNPMFFKEDIIHEIYGSKPSNFQNMPSNYSGVEEGSEKSLAIANETLFYKTRDNVVMYSGGMPQAISRKLGLTKYSNAIAGSKNGKYFISMEDETGTRRLYVYSAQTDTWVEEDSIDVERFVSHKGDLYYYDKTRKMILKIDVPIEYDEISIVGYEAITAPFTHNNPNKKGLMKFQLRCKVVGDATISVIYDDKEEEVIKKIKNEELKSFCIPIIPRRCDSYKIAIRGNSYFELQSLTRTSYNGSEV